MSDVSNGSTQKPENGASNGINRLLDRFRNIEVGFNTKFLTVLNQIRAIVDDPQTEFESGQHAILTETYNSWLEKLNSDPESTEACEYFYQAVGDRHIQLKAADSNFLRCAEPDFFCQAFNCEGVSTCALFDLLGDGSVDLEEEGLDGTKGRDGDDSAQSENYQGNLWEALVGLYRLSVLVCIYLRMPLVKELIDLILSGNPDINRENVFGKIFGEFQNKKRIRDIIMKLLKDDDDNFTEIFKSLQKVISTFSENTPQNSRTQTATPDQGMPREVFDKVLNKLVADRQFPETAVVGRSDIRTCLYEQLCRTSTGKEPLGAVEESERILTETIYVPQIATKEEVQRLRTALDQKTAQSNPSTMGDLGGTIQRMMEAIGSGSEEDLKDILSQNDTPFDIKDLDLESIRKEMGDLDLE